MPSTPFTSFSMTCATVSLSTSASAPIYVVETITVGGAISGYWAMGSEKAASSPNMVKSSAATIADNGCLIKNPVMKESPRFSLSLDAAQQRPKNCFFHFPFRQMSPKTAF